MKTNFFLTGLFILLTCFVNNAIAGNRAGAFIISPMIGGYLFEGDQNLEHKAVYGLGLGYNIDENWGLEGMLNFIDTEFEKDAGDVDVYMYRFDALYHFMPDKKFVPYIATGIGAMTFDPKRDSNDTDFLVDYGAGIKCFVNNFTALRADVRHIISFDETYNNLAYTVGLTFLLGGEKKALTPEYKDSDGDGVYDHLDQCPNTPQGVTVDDAGCPLDSDGDGVFDYLDKCPDTPKEATVDLAGCPLDSDGDGVFDYKDSCSGTPKGAPVNKQGCWILKGVQFDTNKSVIKPVYKDLLKQQAKIFSDNQYIKVDVQGFTDDVGAESYNKKLSLKRAEAVVDYLMSLGIDASRMKAVGYGEKNPVAPNDTAEGRSQNRRIEFKVLH